jgi:hypothetical protein
MEVKPLKREQIITFLIPHKKKYESATARSAYMPDNVK